jgi:hypothetical protein
LAKYADSLTINAYLEFALDAGICFNALSVGDVFKDDPDTTNVSSAA